MEMSSSMASQCKPTRLNSTCSRSADVARNSRGNHAERPPVGQLDPHRVFVKSNASCRNGHARLSTVITVLDCTVFFLESLNP